MHKPGGTQGYKWTPILDDPMGLEIVTGSAKQVRITDEVSSVFDLRPGHRDGHHLVFDRTSARAGNWLAVRMQIVLTMKGGEMYALLKLVPVTMPVEVRSPAQREIDSYLQRDASSPAADLELTYGRVKRSDRTPKDKPRHTERREQLAQQRAHARRHNGR